MKKILLYLTIFTATISVAASNIDLKLATNFGVGSEGGTYYNLYGSNNYSKEKGQQAIFTKKAAFTGSFEAKVLKSFNINKDLKIKVGGGGSIDITKLPILNEFSKVITPSGEKSISLPHTRDWGVGLKEPFQDQVEKLNDGYGIGDADQQMPKVIALSKKSIYASLTAFGTIEIEKMLKNISVYFGLDAGLDIVLEKTEEKVTHKDKNEDFSILYLLERRKNRIRPKVKGYTGINYKGFETEIGFGYPQFVTFGVGYRFNL